MRAMLGASRPRPSTSACSGTHAYRCVEEAVESARNYGRLLEALCKDKKRFSKYAAHTLLSFVVAIDRHSGAWPAVLKKEVVVGIYAIIDMSSKFELQQVDPPACERALLVDLRRYLGSLPRCCVLLVALLCRALNPQPSTLNPQPSTLNPQSSVLSPQPSTAASCLSCCCVLPPRMLHAIRVASRSCSSTFRVRVCADPLPIGINRCMAFCRSRAAPCFRPWSRTTGAVINTSARPDHLGRWVGGWVGGCMRVYAQRAGGTEQRV
jgi:hypothetical protein